MAKMPMSAIFGTFFAIFRPITDNKTLQKYFYLVEEVLSFNLQVKTEVTYPSNVS